MDYYKYPLFLLLAFSALCTLHADEEAKEALEQPPASEQEADATSCDCGCGKSVLSCDCTTKEGKVCACKADEPNSTL